MTISSGHKETTPPKEALERPHASSSRLAESFHFTFGPKTDSLHFYCDIVLL